MAAGSNLVAVERTRRMRALGHALFLAPATEGSGTGVACLLTPVSAEKIPPARFPALDVLGTVVEGLGPMKHATAPGRLAIRGFWQLYIGICTHTHTHTLATGAMCDMRPCDSEEKMPKKYFEVKKPPGSLQ